MLIKRILKSKFTQNITDFTKTSRHYSSFNFEYNENTKPDLQRSKPLFIRIISAISLEIFQSQLPKRMVQNQIVILQNNLKIPRTISLVLNETLYFFQRLVAIQFLAGLILPPICLWACNLGEGGTLVIERQAVTVEISGGLLETNLHQKI